MSDYGNISDYANMLTLLILHSPFFMLHADTSSLRASGLLSIIVLISFHIKQDHS